MNNHKRLHFTWGEVSFKEGALPLLEREMSPV